MQTLSVLLPLCADKPLGTGDFLTHERSVIQTFDDVFVVCEQCFQDVIELYGPSWVSLTNEQKYDDK